MKLAHADYRQAAGLRIDEAWRLYTGEMWVGTVYLAGRAAEAILRSLLALKRWPHEAGHDLRAHLAQVRSLGMLTAEDEAKLLNLVQEVAVVWHNNLRFAGEVAFLRMLKATGRNKQIRGRRVTGDPAKANAKSILDACETIVSRGVLVWKRSQKN